MPRNKVTTIKKAGACIQCMQAQPGPSRFCSNCTESNESWPIPTQEEFEEDVTFVAAPDLAIIGNDLIEHYGDFYGIRHMEPSIDYLWKQKGGQDLGNNILGKIRKPTGELKYYSRADFVVWLAADHCYGFNRFQITAIIFHELLHVDYNDAEERLELRGHEFEGFSREIEVFGCWRKSMKEMATVFAGVKPALRKAS